MFGADSDDKLVRKAIKGKSQAWEKLVTRYEVKLFNYALRLTGNRDDALDLMQNVFLSLYRNLQSWRGEGSFQSWVFRIASNRATDFYRRRKWTESFDNESTLPAIDTPGPDLCLEQGQKNVRVLELMHCLPPEQREVVELKFFQEMTFEEISETVDVSVNTLKSRLYAALRKLKKYAEASYELQ